MLKNDVGIPTMPWKLVRNILIAWCWLYKLFAWKIIIDISNQKFVGCVWVVINICDLTAYFNLFVLNLSNFKNGIVLLFNLINFLKLFKHIICLNKLFLAV